MRYLKIKSVPGVKPGSLELKTLADRSVSGSGKRFVPASEIPFYGILS